MNSTRAACRFCERYGPKGKIPAAPWDIPLLATDEFVVVPTKGALVPGWALVVPRQHVLSCAALDLSHRPALDAILARTEDAITVGYGPCTLFEHGAATHGSAFGCGIDHAHLHVAPLRFSLVAAASALDPQIKWTAGAAPWHGDGGGAPYLAVRGAGASWMNSHPERIPSQFLRQAIASAIGTPHTFAYDEHPFPDVAAELVKRFEETLTSSAA